jgi:hypothetical protein
MTEQKESAWGQGRSFTAFAVVPCWLLFAVAAVPTLLLCYVDRRRIPPGHCRHCGYNLTGNISGVCPECGTPCPQQTTTSQ